MTPLPQAKPVPIRPGETGPALPLRDASYFLSAASPLPPPAPALPPRASGYPLSPLAFCLLPRRGQAALEFLLVLPTFFLITFLGLDLGLTMYHYVDAANAVREAARYASVNCGTGACSADAVRNRAVARSGGLLDAGDVTVGWIDRNGDGSNRNRGDSVVVQVAHTYQFRFLRLITFPIIACADMGLEQMDGTRDLPVGNPCPR